MKMRELGGAVVVAVALLLAAGVAWDTAVRIWKVVHP